jgi:hypothetical protein
MAAMFVLGLVVLTVFFVCSYLVMRFRVARRGFDAFTSDSTLSYVFDDDAFHASEMISIGSHLVSRPLPELMVDRSALRITLQSAGIPEVLGIWRLDVDHMYTRRGINGVGFSFKDGTHKADGLTIWCGSREPLWSTLAELGWLTSTSKSERG